MLCARKNRRITASWHRSVYCSITPTSSLGKEEWEGLCENESSVCAYVCVCVCVCV